MKVNNTILYLDKLQYFLSLIVLALILISLIPGIYNSFSYYLLMLVLINLIISLIRGKYIKLMFLFIILLLLMVGIFPYIGWLFRLFTLPFAILSLSLNENTFFYKRGEFVIKNKINSKKPFNNTKTETKETKTKPKYKFKDQKIYDAKFEEKEKKE